MSNFQENNDTALILKWYINISKDKIKRTVKREITSRQEAVFSHLNVD